MGEYICKAWSTSERTTDHVMRAVFIYMLGPGIKCRKTGGQYDAYYADVYYQ